MLDQDELENLLQWPVYSLAAHEKQARLLAELTRLTTLHLDACPAYRKVVEKLHFQTTPTSLADIPFIPVRLFKHQRLLSVPEQNIVKTMTSSGTSGHTPSQIFLDKATAALQIKILSKIMADFIGVKRLPMLIIDCKATVTDRYRFSARTAGILGFSMFGRDVEYALDDDMTLNRDRVEAFVTKHEGQDIMMFGFTFIIWQYLVQALEREGTSLPLDKGILLHGGGWKKIMDEAVENPEYKNRLAKVTGIKRIHNYYGMVEQTGSIHMECEEGYLHTPAWAEIIIRDPYNFNPLPVGEKGLVQLLSVMPHSYPGHSLLSEDVGEVIGIDDCRCGRKGSYFRIEGRLEQAEVRGCSDSHQR